MKTRSKRAQQEQAGVPPTPPQQLPTARSTRQKRALRSTASPEAPSDNSVAISHTENTTAAVTKPNARATRGRKRKTEKPLKNADPSLPEIAETEQACAQSEVQDAEVKRETQDSSLNPPSETQDSSLNPHGTPMVSLTAVKQSPESSPLSPPPSGSPVFPSDVGSLALLSSSTLSSISSVSDTSVALDTPCPTKTSGSFDSGQSPLKPCLTASQSQDVSEKKVSAHQDQIYNWPDKEHASEPFTVLNFMINEDFNELVTTGAMKDPLSIAVPTEMIPDLLKFISHHARARKTSLEHLLSDDEFMHRLRKRLTNIDLTVNKDSPLALKRRFPSPDTLPSAQEPILPSPQNTRPSRLRQASLRRATGSPCKPLHEHDQQVNDSPSLSEERPIKRTKLVRQTYNEQGMLTLGAYKEVPIDDSSDDEDVQIMTNNNTDVATTEVDATIPEPNSTPETPGASRWGRITSFLPSVSRFIPSFQSPVRSQPQQPQVPRTEPRPRQGPIEIRAPSTSSRAPQRHRDLAARRQLLTKGEKEIIRKQKEEIKRLRAQLEKQSEKNTIHEDKGDEPSPSTSTLFIRRARREAAELAARQAEQVAQKQAEEVLEKEIQATGSKRKRSLDVIPNPEGGGYGMDLQYFGQDSDEETIIEADEAPRMTTKRARLSTSNDVIGDPHQATPYTGTLFAIPGGQSAAPLHNNSFVAQDLSEASVPDQVNTTTSGPTLTFTVPSDSDSDDSDDPSEEEPAATPASKSTSPVAPKVVAPALETSTMSQPSTTALDKARQTALKHQPIQPSRLREASCLSTSTVASSAGVEEPSEVASEFTSYNHYQQLIPDRVRNAISNSAPASVATSNFEKAFAKWDTPQTTRVPAFQAELKLNNSDQLIDQKVLDRIELVWNNKDSINSVQNGSAGSLGAFEKSLGSWMDHRNSGQAVSAFGS